MKKNRVNTEKEVADSLLSVPCSLSRATQSHFAEWKQWQAAAQQGQVVKRTAALCPLTRTQMTESEKGPTRHKISSSDCSRFTASHINSLKNEGERVDNAAKLDSQTTDSVAKYTPGQLTHWNDSLINAFPEVMDILNDCLKAAG